MQKLLCRGPLGCEKMSVNEIDTIKSDGKE